MVGWARGGRWLAAVLVAGAALVARGDDAQVLREALDAYDRAVAAQAAGRAAEAERLLREAAGGFEALLEGGHRNASLEYDLGNTYLRLGRLGLAILHYRRALRLAPRDADVRANLELARRQVTPRVEPSGRRALLERLLVLRDWAAASTRWRVGTVLWLAGWLAAAVWLARRSQAPAMIALTGIVLGGLVQAELLADLHDQQRRPAGVVVGAAVTLRQGRGQAYERVVSDPLGPGVELRVLERRGDWFRIRLVNDLEGWLPARAVALVEAAAPTGQ